MIAAIRLRITGSVTGSSTPLACAHSLPSRVVNHSDHGCSGEPQRMLFCELITDSASAVRAGVTESSCLDPAIASGNGAY
jgi:hypothetical protein